MPQMYNWMTGIADNLTLSEITMPGSHDAGIHPDAATKKGIVGLSSAVCQDKSIYEQCIAGSRFFDIRLKVSDSGTRTYHLSPVGGALGQSSDTILSDVFNFLDRNRSEFVILRFTKPKGGSEEIVRQVQNSPLQQILFTSPTFVNFATTNIRLLRGKAICVFEADADDKGKVAFNSLMPKDGLHPFLRYTGADHQYGIVACGKYSNSSRLYEVIDGQVAHIDAHANHTRPHLFVLYWTQTFNPKSPWKQSFTTSIKKFSLKQRNFEKEVQNQRISGGAHANLDYLKVLICTGQDLVTGQTKLAVRATTVEDRRRIMPNVIMYDFVNIKTSKEIVSLNDPGLRGHLVEED